MSVCRIKPRPGDPDDYLALAKGGSSPSLCLTPTCASNLIGLVPEGDCARGNEETIKAGFKALSAYLGKPADEAAKDLLRLATRKCALVVNSLVKDYKLDCDMVTLFGGGGGATPRTGSSTANTRFWPSWRPLATVKREPPFHRPR